MMIVKKPKKTEETKKRYLLQVRISHMDLNKLDEICKYTGKTRSYIVRRALIKFYDNTDWKRYKRYSDETKSW